MKNKNGITLIALIITIIVMLILVGVTINVTINGGLLDIAKEAAKKTEEAKWNEELNTTIIAMNADMITNPTQGDIEDLFSKLLDKIEENFELDSKYIYEKEEGIRTLNYIQLILDEYFDNSYDPIRVPCKYNGKDVTLIFETETNEETKAIKIKKVSTFVNNFIVVAKDEPVEVKVGGNVTSIEDGVPIPKGFYYVTGTKETGVVISDSAIDENNPEGNSGNQFVWVPVNVNPRLEIKIDSEKVINEVRILSTGGYNKTINVNSHNFKKEINLTNNAIYQVIATYEDGTQQEIIKEINNVYATYNTVYTLAQISARLQGMSADELIEQIIREEMEKNPEEQLTKMGYLTKISEEFNKYKDDASEKENVLKYGGFYIGRYETSLTRGIRKGVTPTSDMSYEVAKTAVETQLYTDKEQYGVTADLPSAAAWDAIGGWLLSTGAKDTLRLYFDSSSWGNYKVRSSNETTLASAGSRESYKANNIYDLAGNLEEWTKEVVVGKNSETNQNEITANITRGGNYSTIGYSPFSNRGEITANSSTTEIGGRPMLYIND